VFTVRVATDTGVQNDARVHGRPVGSELNAEYSINRKCVACPATKATGNALQ